MTAKLVLFAAFVISMLLMSINHKKKRKKIVFFGDSITRQGMNTGGYIRRMIRLLREEGIEDDFELAGAGVDGDKVYDLYLRMDEDILAKGADVVVIFVGVNDVGHKYSTLTGTDINRFHDFYTTIINKLLAAEIKVVLCTPGVIGENIDFTNEEDEELNSYSNVIRELSVQHELPLVDIRKAFMNYISANNPADKEMGVLTTDRVHLNDRGNQLVAEEMWKVLKEMK